MLEVRLALAVDVAYTTPSTGAGETWSTILVNDGSDAYMKVVATPTEELFVADNASFANRQVISNIDALDTVNIFNGQFVQRDAFQPNADFGMPVGYPWLGGDVNNADLIFILPSSGIDLDERVTGTLDLNDGSANDTIFFDNLTGPNLTPGTAFRITSGPGVGGPLLYFLSTSGGSNPQLTIRFDNSTLFGNTVGQTGVPTLSMTYDASTYTFFDARDFITVSDIGAAVPEISRPTVIDLLDESFHQYVPGTLSGTIELMFGPSTVSRINFQAQETVDRNGDNIDISFWNTSGGFHRPDRLATGSLGTFLRRNTSRFPGASDYTSTEEITIDGDFDPDTGLLSLYTRVRGTPRQFSIYASQVSMGIRDIDASNDPADPLGLLFDGEPNAVTLYPGMTLQNNVYAELPNPGSEISIESPIVTQTPQNFLRLSASEINLNAPVRTATLFEIPGAEDTVFGGSTERVNVAAALSSNAFDIRLADDESTSNVQRSRFLVTQTGTVSNLGDVLSRPPQALPSADSMFLEVVDGDIYLEGRVVVQDQSYLIRSPKMEPDTLSQIGDYPNFVPYQLTTNSSLTGVGTGIIEANTLAITLANDSIVLPDPKSTDPFVASTAFAIADLNTDVSALRVQASDRVNDPLALPFPYKLTIREDNDLVIDAVAASSQKIDIGASGSIDLLAKMETAGDLRVSSAEQFIVSAPISTRFGVIEIEAPELVVNNSVRVLDAVQDEREVDVRLVATAGGMQLNDAVSGINRIVLEQAGVSEATGSTGVRGDARIIGDVVEINSDDAVIVRTNAPRVSVRTVGEVNIEESDYGVFEIRDARNVTLVANGYDQVVRAGDIGRSVPGSISDDRAFLSPALFADVYDTEVLTVSAPNGSVDIFHYGEQELQIGDLQKIGAETETRMEAAGSVSIRSTLAGMTVYDAPSAVGNARQVRLASTSPLIGTYENRSPGVVPSRLNNVRLTRVNSANISMSEAGLAVPGVNPSFRYARELDQVDVTTLRVGDDILVKNGTQPSNGVPTLMTTNGIYTIVGVHYPVGDTSYVEVDLVRRADSDTTDDLAKKHYVKVVEGRTNVGTVWTADGTKRDVAGDPVYGGWGNAGEYSFVNVFDNSPLTVPVRIQPVMSRSGYTDAVATTTLPLASGSYEATYDHNAGTIDGVGFTMPRFDGVDVEVGEKVLVRYGAMTPSGEVDPRSLGLYQVVSRGNGVSTPWQLKRYEGIDEDGDGLLDSFFTGLVAINEGSLRTSVRGEMFEITLESLGFSSLRYQEVSQRTSAATPKDQILQYDVDIGSNDPLDSVTFVVSTEGQTNNSTGSFGKMLGLYQGNVAVNSRTGESQSQSLEFDQFVTNIELRQELPPIYRSGVDISSGHRVTLDGRYIDETWEGKPVRSSSVVAAVGPLWQAEQFVGRRLSRSGVMAVSDRVHGLQLTPTADRSRISGLAIGGFTNGAGILVESADNVLLRDIIVGRSGVGGALNNSVGVEITGQNVQHTTLQSMTVVGSQQSGILLGTGTEKVHVVGSTIGAVGASNAVGISLMSESRTPSYVGSSAGAFSSNFGVSGIVETVDPASDEADLLFAVDSVTAQFRPGLTLWDGANRIARTVQAVQYETSGTSDVIDDFYRVTVDDASSVGADTGVGDLVMGDTFAAQLGHRVESVTSSGVVTERDLEIYLPTTISERDVFVGQSVASSQGVFAQNTVIESIATVGGRTKLTLSNRAVDTGVALLLLGTPGTNQVVGNGDGIRIDGHASSIVNTIISNSVYDGIRIERSDNVGDGGTPTLFGKHVIGDALGTVAGPNGTVTPTSLSNVLITGNGLAGIRFTNQAFAALGSIVGVNTTPSTIPGGPADPDAFADYAAVDSFMDGRLRIRGNYIGYNPTTDAEVGNGPTGVENIIVDLKVGDAHYNERARIEFLLRDDSTPLSDNGTPSDLTDDPPFARLRPTVSTSLDSFFNQYGTGDGIDQGGGDDREVTPPRRPVVR